MSSEGVNMQGEELDRTLSKICREQAPIAVISVDSGGVGRGRISAVSEERITIELYQVGKETEFRLLSKCVCLFRVGDGGCVFLASVRSFEPDHVPQVLELHKPREAVCESRRTFRIPVQEQRPTVELTDENHKSLQFNVVDMSVSGALVEHGGEECSHLPVGSHFKAKFQLGELSVVLSVEVRRKYGNRYGLFFSEVLDQEELKAPAELAKMLSRLEQTWLDAKKSEGSGTERSE